MVLFVVLLITSSILALPSDNFSKISNLMPHNAANGNTLISDPITKIVNMRKQVRPFLFVCLHIVNGLLKCCLSYQIRILLEKLVDKNDNVYKSNL